MRVSSALLAGLLLVTMLDGIAVGQPARLGNGTVTTRTLTGSLDQAIERARSAAIDARWVGFEIATVPGDRWMCDWNEWTRQQPPATSARLEPAEIAYVFVRLEANRIDRVRLFSPGCAIDAAGRPVTWFTGVAPAESVRTLSGLARVGERKVVDGALAALSMHAAPTALATTIDLARSGPTPHTRGQALFWLAQRAGAQAAGAIDDAVARDPDTDVKKRAVFALSQLPPDQGVPRLMQVARTHSNAAVRKQAMFWLGQSKDPRALAFFESVLLK
ncbi:MAG: HEAT repeat domain-containing protein [Vicinamibacterales bacterium]